MKWSSESVLLIILIHFAVLSDSRSKAELNFLNRYVTPNRTVRCFNGQLPCQTLEQYATRPEIYFMNNTYFYFQSGNHQLNDTLLKLRNLRNVIFKGLPNNKNMVNIFLDSFVSIVWENCWFVQITSINFILPDIYYFSIVFKQIQLIQLYNISVTTTDRYYSTGCSAILSQQSGIGIKDCKFIGLQGSVGAAMMLSESSAITSRNNTFADNAAFAGGSICLSNSTLTLNGTNLFKNNEALYEFYDYSDRYDIYEDIMSDLGSLKYTKMLLYMYISDGGAILCSNCTLIINEHSTFERNNAEDGHGGAIAGQDGRISIHDYTLFDSIFCKCGRSNAP